MTAGRDRLALVAAALTFVGAALFIQRDLLPRLAHAVYLQNMIGQDCLLHVWTLAWGQHALATDPCRVLDANIFFPNPRALLYSDHLLGLAITFAPLRLLTRNVVLIHNTITVAAPALNAMAAYLLVRELTQRHSAALIGGLLFGFAPLRVDVDRCQLQMLAGWWVPLAWWSALRLLRGGRFAWAIVTGSCLTLQALTSIYLTAFFAPFLAFAHLVWWRRWPIRSHPGWWPLLAAEALAVLSQLPLMSAYRLVQSDLGATRPLLLNAILSLQPELLPTFMAVGTMLVLAIPALGPRRWLPPVFTSQRPVVLAMIVGGLVFALGPAMALPGGRGSFWGPYALLLHLPGFSALRVPARMLHVVLLGASLMAAGGFAVLTTRLRGIGLGAATLLAVVAVVVESRVPRFQLIPAPPPGLIDPVYHWLAAEPSAMRLVELPVDPFRMSNAVVEYASTAHWKPLVNGTSGITPPSNPYLLERLERFPDEDVVAELVALGVTHAVVHTNVLNPETRARLGAVERRGRVLKRRWVGPRTIVYSLRRSLRPPTVVPAGKPLDPRSWTLSATTAVGTLPFVFDGDPTTTWWSWADLDAGLRDQWYNPMPVLDRWYDYLKNQPTRLTIDLNAPALVTSFTVRLGGTDPLALPLIWLESSLDGKRWARFPAPLRPVPDVRALVQSPRLADFGAVAPRGVRARWLRLNAEAHDWHVGDLAVYAGVVAPPKLPVRAPKTRRPGAGPRPRTGPHRARTPRPASRKRGR